LNVALPSIQHSLRAGEGVIEWVVAGYTISTAVLLVTGGRLGDQFGRRRVFAVGMAIFVATSAVCALAPDPSVLIAARVVQGVGAALMAPNILSILGVVYTGPARVRAISIYGMVMGLAATSGQIIGGILIRTDVAGLGSRTIFWINVPIGVAALLAAPRLIPESRDQKASRLDLTGVTLITACLLAVVLPLVEGLLAAARRAAHPGGVLVPAGGLVPGPRTVPAAGTRPVAPGGRRDVHLPGRRLPGHLVPGSGADHALRPVGDRCRSPDRGPGRRRPVPGHGTRRGQRIGGLADSRAAAARRGAGLCITPLTTTVLSHADPATAGSVSGALSTAQQVGNSVGVAVTGVLFFGALSQGYDLAFERSVLQMGALLLVVAALTRLMPGRQRGLNSLKLAGTCRAGWPRLGRWNGRRARWPRRSSPPSRRPTGSTRSPWRRACAVLPRPRARGGRTGAGRQPSR
jgi:MFS family permease